MMGKRILESMMNQLAFDERGYFGLDSIMCKRESNTLYLPQVNTVDGHKNNRESTAGCESLSEMKAG